MYYHLGLHYSQTVQGTVTVSLSFYYHLGLHYSQTSNLKIAVESLNVTKKRE